MENPSPSVISKSLVQRLTVASTTDLRQPGYTCEPIDALEVFEIIRGLRDPEYPLSLEELGVVGLEMIQVTGHRVQLRFTPTVPHCSQATLIGLMLRCILMWSLPASYSVEVRVSPGTHSSEKSINKQLADKERVIAALENPNVLGMIIRGVSRTRSLDDAVKRNIWFGGSAADKMDHEAMDISLMTIF